MIEAGSDDEILADEDKRLQQQQQQQYQKKKRRPSFKRRKKAVYDHAQTDSGIDSRMGIKELLVLVFLGEFQRKVRGVKVIGYCLARKKTKSNYARRKERSELNRYSIYNEL